MDIIFVTYKKLEDCEDTRNAFEELQHCLEPEDRLLFTGIDASASVNRNYGLAQSVSDIFIMVDDDIRGYYKGWVEDMVQPLVEDPAVICSSARLLNSQGSPGSMMGNNNIYLEGAHISARVAYKDYFRLPTACVALRRNSLRFDENFIASGYEDTDYMNQLNIMYPNGFFVINNNCKLIHKNEQKKQGGLNFLHNKEYYLSKYPDDTTVKNQQDWTVCI